ncbi:MAG TPA: VOC family protein [Pyrinomonadaceae bacterium]|nr:VOC family protein [Pyrinomonadaceae bacterium]
MKQKITPFLWFDNNAEEAVAFYTSVFKESNVGAESNYNEASSEVSGQPKGSVMVLDFEIAGQKFIALNGGPHFKFTEAVSFVVDCRDQEEIDYYWSRLTADGGQESQCGWLKDKFGLSWQIVPSALTQLVGGTDRERARRATEAMMKMKKLDIQKLQDAYDGK